MVFHYSYTFQLLKCENGTSRVPKLSKLCTVTSYIKMDNFHFCPNSQIPLDFELKIQETNPISNLLESLKGVQTFGEKFHKFIKILP
jgi:hypothetical protein